MKLTVEDTGLDNMCTSCGQAGGFLKRTPGSECSWERLELKIYDLRIARVELAKWLPKLKKNLHESQDLKEL